MYLEERILNESNSFYAYRMIRKNIVRLGFAPCSVINEHEIAAELNMSRTPVREALQSLAKNQIIDIYPQRGMYVAAIDYDLIEDAMFMRKSMEVELLDLFSKNASESDIARIEANLDMQRFYLKNFDQDKLILLDDEFHRIFFEVSGKMNSYWIQRSFNIHFDRVRYLSIGLDDVNQTFKDHEDIIRYLREGDVERAKEVLKIHLSRYQNHKIVIQKNYGHYFK